MPPRILCLEFEADAGAGRLGAGLEALGVSIQTVALHADVGLPGLAGYHGVLVMGGSMNADDDDHYLYLPSVVALLREAHARAVPTLGVCLGGQLLARALGGHVWRKPAMEIGYFPIQLTEAGRADPLFAGLPSAPLAFQWHEDAFDVPPGAVVLADSRPDTLQAFRLGSCYGLQFHPEVTVQTVAGWCRSNPLALESAADRTASASLLQQAGAFDSLFADQTAKLCRNWLEIIDEAPSAATEVS